MSWRKKKDEEENEGNPFDFFNNGFFNNGIFERFWKEIEQFMHNEPEEDSSIIRKTYGPYYYGRITTIGPDGKPVVKEYGNMIPNEVFGQRQIPEALPEMKEESLIDAFIDDKTVRIIAEIPGIDKDDIDIKATESKVMLSAKNDSKNYSTEKELTVKINPKNAKANYKNSILEIIFERKNQEEKEDEFEVKIE
ncbi:MAG: Hsp20/alpha crystallin family protein [Candidatus Heimdallarchaeota archaeon]|nr:Hsp20/alpha crystallin family protein [Candidatus Heimdallarchaeota archaeon]